ncbi:MAG: DegV family protein [Actinobacteria bacterium]|nr:DegV family protein [Actinomycetota bacterium]
MKIGFVTDSTSYLPENIRAQFDVEVVPVQVVIDGKAYDEGSEITSEIVAQALKQGKAVTTSRPSSAQFIAAYQRVLDRGYDQIISVHLSSELSGTYESALLAVAKSELPVRVIDSRNIALAMGYPLIGGVRLARTGAPIDDVEDYIRNRCEQSTIIFYVDSLEHLKRGGRISALQSRIGTALSLKPLLTVVNGQIVQRELVRNSQRALARIVEIAQSSGTLPSELAILHVTAQNSAEKIAAQISQKLDNAEIPVIPAGAVVGTHLGPGAIALVISPLS